MSNASSSAILADALSVLSKTTHQILADAEARSRSEVARATADANEARHQRDDAMKEAHALQLEVEALRRENTAAKASHAQAELRVAHQLDTLNQNAEVIAQLRREVNQWKDQSKNWQEHFLRVEQERCALSSRIDELVSERLQFCRNPSTVHTPLFRYQERGGPSGSDKREQSSPMKSSALKAPLPLSDEENPSPNTTGSTSKESRSKPRRPPGSSAKKRALHTPANVDSPLSHVKASSSQSRNIEQTRTANHKPTTIRSSTVIRRVQAVVQVKREESDEDADPNSEQSLPQQSSQSSGEPRVRRKRSRLIVEDPQDDGEDSDDGATVARSLRTVKPLNYEESDFEEQESDEDELMIRNEDKREGATSSNRSKPSNGPPTKKRKKVS